jgi:hypothetical protein
MPTPFESNLICAALIAVILAYCVFEYELRRYYLEKLYVGFGWVLSWEKGHVIIRSRLLDSPSGRAEVIIGSTLCSMNGVPLHFETLEQWKEFKKGNFRPKR